jgi:hypothetical protein
MYTLQRRKLGREEAKGVHGTLSESVNLRRKSTKFQEGVEGTL